MATDQDPQRGARAAAGLFGELQRYAVGGHDVVAPDGAFVLVRRRHRGGQAHRGRSCHVSPERPANRGVAVRPRASCLSRSSALFPERDRSRRHAQQFHRDSVRESLRLRARRRAARRLTSSCSLPSVYSLLFSRCRDSLRGEFTTILPRSVPYRPRRSRRHQDRGWELGLRRRICPCDSPPRRHGAGDFGRSAPGSLEPDTSVVCRRVNQLT